MMHPLGGDVLACLWLTLCTVEQHVGIPFRIVSPFQINWRDSPYGRARTARFRNHSCKFLTCFLTGVHFIWPPSSCEACSQAELWWWWRSGTWTAWVSLDVEVGVKVFVCAYEGKRERREELVKKLVYCDQLSIVASTALWDECSLSPESVM